MASPSPRATPPLLSSRHNSMIDVNAASLIDGEPSLLHTTRSRGSVLTKSPPISVDTGDQSSLSDFYFPTRDAETSRHLVESSAAFQFNYGEGEKQQNQSLVSKIDSIIDDDRRSTILASPHHTIPTHSHELKPTHPARRPSLLISPKGVSSVVAIPSPPPNATTNSATTPDDAAASIAPHRRTPSLSSFAHPPSSSSDHRRESLINMPPMDRAMSMTNQRRPRHQHSASFSLTRAPSLQTIPQSSATFSTTTNAPAPSSETIDEDTINVNDLQAVSPVIAAATGTIASKPSFSRTPSRAFGGDSTLPLPLPGTPLLRRTSIALVANKTGMVNVSGNQEEDELKDLFTRARSHTPSQQQLQEEALVASITGARASRASMSMGAGRLISPSAARPPSHQRQSSSQYASFSQQSANSGGAHAPSRPLMGLTELLADSKMSDPPAHLVHSLSSSPVPAESGNGSLAQSLAQSPLFPIPQSQPSRGSFSQSLEHRGSFSQAAEYKTGADESSLAGLAHQPVLNRSFSVPRPMFSPSSAAAAAASNLKVILSVDRGTNLSSVPILSLKDEMHRSLSNSPAITPLQSSYPGGGIGILPLSSTLPPPLSIGTPIDSALLGDPLLSRRSLSGMSSISSMGNNNMPPPLSLGSSSPTPSTLSASPSPFISSELSPSITTSTSSATATWFATQQQFGRTRAGSGSGVVGGTVASPPLQQRSLSPEKSLISSGLQTVHEGAREFFHKLVNAGATTTNTNSNTLTSTTDSSVSTSTSLSPTAANNNNASASTLATISAIPSALLTSSLSPPLSIRSITISSPAANNALSVPILRPSSRAGGVTISPIPPTLTPPLPPRDPIDHSIVFNGVDMSKISVKHMSEEMKTPTVDDSSRKGSLIRLSFERGSSLSSLLQQSSTSLNSADSNVSLHSEVSLLRLKDAKYFSDLATTGSSKSLSSSDGESESLRAVRRRHRQPSISYSRTGTLAQNNSLLMRFQQSNSTQQPLSKPIVTSLGVKLEGENLETARTLLQQTLSESTSLKLLQMQRQAMITQQNNNRSRRNLHQPDKPATENNTDTLHPTIRAPSPTPSASSSSSRTQITIPLHGRRAAPTAKKHSPTRPHAPVPPLPSQQPQTARVEGSIPKEEAGHKGGRRSALKQPNTARNSSSAGRSPRRHKVHVSYSSISSNESRDSDSLSIPSHMKNRSSLSIPSNPSSKASSRRSSISISTNNNENENNNEENNSSSVQVRMQEYDEQRRGRRGGLKQHAPPPPLMLGRRSRLSGSPYDDDTSTASGTPLYELIEVKTPNILDTIAGSPSNATTAEALQAQEEALQRAIDKNREESRNEAASALADDSEAGGAGTSSVNQVPEVSPLISPLPLHKPSLPYFPYESPTVAARSTVLGEENNYVNKHFDRTFYPIPMAPHTNSVSHSEASSRAVSLTSRSSSVMSVYHDTTAPPPAAETAGHVSFRRHPSEQKYFLQRLGSRLRRQLSHIDDKLNKEMTGLTGAAIQVATLQRADGERETRQQYVDIVTKENTLEEEEKQSHEIAEAEHDLFKTLLNEEFDRRNQALHQRLERIFRRNTNTSGWVRVVPSSSPRACVGWCWRYVWLFVSVNSATGEQQRRENTKAMSNNYYQHYHCHT